jgi:hypothetical protein
MDVQGHLMGLHRFSGFINKIRLFKMASSIPSAKQVKLASKTTINGIMWFACKMLSSLCSSGGQRKQLPCVQHNGKPAVVQMSFD